MDITSKEKNLLLCLGDILFVVKALEGEKEINRTPLIDLLNSAMERLNCHLNAGIATPSRYQSLQTIELNQRCSFPNGSSKEYVKQEEEEEEEESKLLTP